MIYSIYVLKLVFSFSSNIQKIFVACYNKCIEKNFSTLHELSLTHFQTAADLLDRSQNPRLSIQSQLHYFIHDGWRTATERYLLPSCFGQDCQEEDKRTLPQWFPSGLQVGEEQKFFWFWCSGRKEWINTDLHQKSVTFSHKRRDEKGRGSIFCLSRTHYEISVKTGANGTTHLKADPSGSREIR